MKSMALATAETAIKLMAAVHDGRDSDVTDLLIELDELVKRMIERHENVK